MTELSIDIVDEEATAIDADESAKPWDPSTDPDGYTRDEISPKDGYLDTILDFTHGLNDESLVGHVGLTVITGGALVSGLAISRAAWIAGMVDAYAQASPDTAPHIEKIYNRRHGSVLSMAAGRDAADLPTLARLALHMKDVQISIGGVTTNVSLWRGSLADVTGWSFGSWNRKQDPEVD